MNVSDLSNLSVNSMKGFTFTQFWNELVLHHLIEFDDFWQILDDDLEYI